MGYKGKNDYKKIKVDFVVPKDLDKMFDDFINYLNSTDGSLEDCYRDELGAELNWYIRGDGKAISIEQAEFLKDYYVRGGVYGE